MVLVDVGAVLQLAFVAHAGAHHLAQAIDIEALQAQALLNLLTHLLCPGLGSESAHTQFDLVFGNANLFHGLCQVKGIGRGTGNAGNPQVANQFGVLLRIAGRGRDHRSAHHLHAVVRTQAARKQAVTVGHGENVVAAHAVSGKAARHTLAPNADILAGVTHDGGVARGARRGVDADNLALGSRLQAKGIVVPKVLLGGERQFYDVIDGADIVRCQIHLLQLVAVEGYVVVNILHNLVKAFALERAHLVATHTFFVGIPNHICSSFYYRGWSSWKAFIRSSKRGYRRSSIRLVQARTPPWSLPVVASEMELTP